MGLVAKQSIKQSLVAYLGVVFGIVNSLFIYPLAFRPEELGLVRFVMDTATLLSPFLLLGANNVSVKYFPFFKNKNNHNNGFFGLLLLIVFISISLFVLLQFFLSNKIEILLIQGEKSELIIRYWRFIIPLTALFVFNNLFSKYISNFHKIVIPEIITNLYIKIGLPLLALAYFFHYIEFSYIINGIVIIYILGLISFIVYTKFLGALNLKLNFSFLHKKLVKEIGSFAGYSVLGNLGNVIALRIDIFMLAFLSAGSLKDVGVYSIAVIISNIMIVPAKAIYSITAPLLADAWKEKNLKEINVLYKRTSIILFSIGILVLVGILASIEDLFKIMPNGDLYNTGIWVILLLGSAKLIELITSVNQQIIEFSQFYKFNFYAVLILAVLNVINNYIFIPIFNLEGAALATLCSVLLFNVAKVVFIKWKFNMMPFQKQSVIILILGIIIYFISIYINFTPYALLNILIRSAFILISFLGSMLFFNISDDFTSLYRETVKRITNFIS